MHRTHLLLALLPALLPASGCFPENRRGTDTAGPTDTDTNTDTDEPNAAPSGAAIAITPTDPTDADTLTCTIEIEATDPNGDEVRYAYAWAVDGADAGVTAATVASALTAGGQTWSCTVTPSDGRLEGTPSTARVTIAADNLAPSAPTVSIAPESPADADVLNCVIETESVDPDGDAVVYSYAWRVDGADAGVTSTTVSASLTSVGQAWTCSVTASDGDRSSAAGTASVEVGSDIPPFIDYATTYGAEMVAITAGSFDMGSADYGPVHTVTLTHDFWMGQTEVTQAQWLSGMGTSPSYFPSCGSDCPVEQVSWEDAAMYANALSADEGMDLCYTATGSALVSSLAGDPYACEGYRLPTEAEWEYAARAGEAYTYSGSDTVGTVAWLSGNSGRTTHPVATRTANAWGLYDMSGNVYEWTNDWYVGYSSGAAADPVGASSGSYRVVRGGCWNYGASDARVADRSYSAPSYRDWYLGFRLSRSSLVP